MSAKKSNFVQQYYIQKKSGNFFMEKGTKQSYKMLKNCVNIWVGKKDILKHSNLF